METQNDQRPQECVHYCPLCYGTCDLDIKETSILGGGYWIKCCDLVDNPEYICPDFTPKTDKDGKI